VANLIVNIWLPVLVANQGFLIEYRAVGAGSWTVFGIEQDNSATITGLTEGVCYQVRITFLMSLSPQIGCNPVIETYCIPTTEPCGSISGEITKAGDVYTLQLDLGLPSPYSDPCGGWRIVYGEITSPQQPYVFINYSTLVGMSPIVIPGVQNVPYYVAIYAIDCEGNETKCDEDTVEPYSVPCEHAVVSEVRITQSGGAWYLVFEIVPSSPASTQYYISYHQANNPTIGVNDPGGSVIVIPAGGNPEYFFIPISPNLNLADGIISYVGSVVDDCRYSSLFDITAHT
jgi:hypothetical protein